LEYFAFSILSCRQAVSLTVTLFGEGRDHGINVGIAGKECNWER
jgi:hypothetical protein